MDYRILEPQIQLFIRDNTGADTAKLALKKNPFPGIDYTEIINQVAARQKAESKLPTWFAANGIIYPPRISVEQTSSETAAYYKSVLVSGESLIDLTGGFGIDDYYFAKRISKVTHCELNLELSAIAAHNFKQLRAGNIECMPGDSTYILRLLNRQYDWIYIDPSRRNDAKGKVFMLKDCLPNVPELLDFYFRYSRNVMVKTAPLLDITAGLGELHSVKAIHIVAVNNEVKELLWLLEKEYTGEPALYAVSITKDGTDVFAAYNCDESLYALPQQYLYEPNSAIMKSGAFDAVSHHYNIGKLHKNTHLYTSGTLIDFPGRRFAIQSVLPYGKAGMKETMQGKKMNITVRNFPLSVDEIRKKWKIKDGGDSYAFFTTNMENEKIVLLCAKL